MVLTLNRLTNPDIVHHRTDQGVSGRGTMEQSLENGLEHAITEHVFRESPQNTLRDEEKFQ